MQATGQNGFRNLLQLIVNFYLSYFQESWWEVFVQFGRGYLHPAVWSAQKLPVHRPRPSWCVEKGTATHAEPVWEVLPDRGGLFEGHRRESAHKVLGRAWVDTWWGEMSACHIRNHIKIEYTLFHNTLNINLFSCQRPFLLISDVRRKRTLE